MLFPSYCENGWASIRGVGCQTLWAMTRNVIPGSYSRFIISFLRILRTDFYSGCASLQSHQYWMRISFSLHPVQHLLSMSLLIFAILTEVMQNLKNVWFALLWLLATMKFFEIFPSYFFSFLFWELSVQVPGPFLNGLFSFWTLYVLNF